MRLLRSLAFNVLFYLNAVIFLVGALPTLFMHRRHTLAATRAWAGSINWLLRWVAGITVEVRGLDRIPPGPLLIAAKHQSAWETLALFPLLDDPSFVLKRELMSIPLLGRFCAHMELIPVDRDAGSDALRAMTARARKAVADGRQIIIFPEGTRRPVGAPPDYKPGVALLYRALGVPCIPVALNSGACWPRRTFLRHSGKIIVEFLPPLPPGLPRDAFLTRLETEIETASARLLADDAT